MSIHDPVVNPVDELTLKRFKCLSNTSLDVRRINVLTGTNSSGKSSVLQSILVEAQSRTSETLQLNGHLTRLGVPTDVIQTGHKSMELGFGCTIDDQRYSYGTSFSASNARGTLGDLLPMALHIQRIHDDGTPRPTPYLKAKRVSSRQGREIERQIAEVSGRQWGDGLDGSTLRTWLSVEAVESWVPDREVYVQLAGSRLRMVAIHQDLAATERDLEVVVGSRWKPADGRPQEAQDAWGSSVLDAHFAGDILPSWGRGRPNRAFEAALSFETTATFDPASRRTQMGRALDDFLSTLEKSTSQRKAAARDLHRPWRALAVPAIPAPSKSQQIQWPWSMRIDGIPMPKNLKDALVVAVGMTLSRLVLSHDVRYMGPLRDEPRVIYLSSASSKSAPLGVRGERLAEFLLQFGKKQITYSKPDRTVQADTLHGAVTTWLNALEIGSDLDARREGKLGFGVRLRVGISERDLTEIGVGASQLLPVVVLVLSAPPGALIILEQPELHLHPSVQARLADFVAFARPDVRILLETHSEYLVTRLRRRVAEGSINEEDVNISFVEQNSSGVSSINRLTVDKFGDLSVWPTGFFDQTDEDYRYLLKASARLLSDE